MVLTTKQEQGLKIAVERWKNKEKYTVISGYAGTGKSTLVKYIVAAIGIDPEEVCYTSFTGNAVEVLRKKGNRNTCTLHSLLYEHFPNPRGGFFRRKKSSIPYSLVIVDEVSMAPKELMETLFSHRCHIICLGDPFQLPPINKNDDNGLLAKPHIFLDEIMRQEKDSEIVQLSLKIREGKPISYYDGEKIKILPKNLITMPMLTWADQVLVGTNATRQNFNQSIRTYLGREDHPQDGDKVICLRNYWDDVNSQGGALVNGTIGVLKNSFDTFRQLPPFIKGKQSQFDILQADFVTDDGEVFKDVEMDKHMILTGDKCCDWQLAYRLGKLKEKYGEIVPKEFSYGYAITAHKAQGSEWDKVVVFEEKFPYEPQEHARWLYTAVTRASNKLILFR